MIKRLTSPVALALGFLALVLLTAQQSRAAVPIGVGWVERQPAYRAWADSTAGLKPRAAPTKPEHATIDPEHYAGYVVLKFQEGTQVRLRSGRLTSLAGVDLSAVVAVLADYPNVQPVRLFHRPEHLLEQERLRGQALSGWQLADLNLYYVLPIADAAQAVQLSDALDGLDVVEIAYPEPLAEPAEVAGQQVLGDKGLPTPSFFDNQGYLFAPDSHNGVNAVYAWTLPGGAGQGVKFIDIELDWRTTHEDLMSATLFYVGGSPAGYGDHGTAVVGEVVADNDEFGVTGIAHDAYYGVQSVTSWPIVADAINTAAAQLDPGDMILLELHYPGPYSGEYCLCNCGQFEYIAIEYWQANFDAIQTASANGIIVVEAGGNGGMNFDNPIYGGAFDLNVRDSGAIVVGAGLSGQPGYMPARGAECWTNYGSRIDVQGWGDSIWTLGYSYGWHEGMVGGDPNDRDQWYTNHFGGTSGASPIVVGVIASINGMREAAGWPVSTPLEARQLLRNVGTEPPRDHKTIRRLPDLRAAAAGLFHTVTFTDVLGNGSGGPDPGESGLELEIGLQTLGITTFTNVSASLSSSLPGLTILTPTQVYPTLSPTGGVALRSFAFELDDDVPCGVSLPFTLAVTTDQGPYSATFSWPTGLLASSPLIFESTDVPKPIPDGSSLGALSVLTIPYSLPIGDLDLQLWVSHPRVTDLHAYLRGPDGGSTEVKLFSFLSVPGANFNGTILSDEGISSIYNSPPPHGVGPYRPDGFLADFGGRPADGTWELYIRDIIYGSAGVLDNWSLLITPRVCTLPGSLAGAKTGPNFVAPGQLLTYTLTVSNVGDLALGDVRVTETYDANTSFVGADPPPTSGDNFWYLAQLEGRSVWPITITVQVFSDVVDYTVLTNTVRIDAADTSPITVTETSTVLRLPQLSIGKGAEPEPVGSWRPVTYTLALSNAGGPATGVVVTDALPLGASFVGCAGGVCGESGGVVSWSDLSVPASGTLELSLVVSACTGPLVNAAYRVAGSDQGVGGPWGAPVTTTVAAPELVAAWEPVSVTVAWGTRVVLSSTSHTDGGPLVAWAWDWGDGASSWGQVVSHTYAAAGVYTVSLVVTDTCGYAANLTVPQAVRVSPHFQVFLPIVLRDS